MAFQCSAILIHCIMIYQANKHNMVTFEINTNGIFSLKEKSKEFYKMLIGGIIFYLLLFVVIKYTILDYSFFIFLTIFLSFIYLFIFVYSPISLKVRINKVIKKIVINETKVLFTANKELTFNKNELDYKIVKRQFTGFSNVGKDGILVKTKSNKEYWIIEDFYNDYDELKNKLVVMN